MFVKKLLHELNIVSQCRRLNVGFWSCPQFIFLIMGIVVISMILVTYIVGQRFVDTQIITLIILFVTIFLLFISFIVVRAFERIVDLRERETKQAKEILELKDQFVFIAAHELRTPANAIKWGLNALRSEKPALFAEAKDLFNIIKRGNNRLLSLVDDLLEVSRIESGTIDIMLKEISANDAFQQACQAVQPLADQHQVTIHCQIDKLPLVQADAIRLKEVFTQLLSNAIKYSPEESSVEVSTETKGGIVTFHVTDKGNGITDEDQKHIFEKFWRSKAVRDTEGSGLGLFITKELVELMSGKIWFTSKVGVGTTVSFSLGLAEHVKSGKLPP